MNSVIKKHALTLITAVVLILPISVFAVVAWMEKKWSTLPVVNGEHHTITDFQLTNQHNKTVSRRQWKGQIVVVNFFFTHCPVICPKMTANLLKVKAAFPDEAAITVNSFSVDPERDSVQQLRTFAERFGIAGNWNLLTGEKAVIYNLARNSFLVAATENAGTANDFIHSEKLVLIDSKQRIRGYYNGTAANTAQQVIQDIKKLQNEK